MALPRIRSALPVALVALTIAALAIPAGAAAQGATATCPATFQVLHDDYVGKLSLPAGPYTITVRGGLSCASASDLFRQFLEDWDGKLPRPWVLNVVDGHVHAREQRRDRVLREARFQPQRRRWRRTPPGQRSDLSVLLPGAAQRPHRQAQGAPPATTAITILAVGRISCASASRLFAQFLQDFDGRLPRPWILDVQTGTFLRGSAHVGFRVKRASGKPVNPNGGGTHPSDGTLCSATFRVLHNDRIGSLRLPRGPYRVTLLRGPG